MKTKLHRYDNGNWTEIKPKGYADWGDIENKPSEFEPEAHTHDASDIDSGVFSGLDTIKLPNNGSKVEIQGDGANGSGLYFYGGTDESHRLAIRYREIGSNMFYEIGSEAEDMWLKGDSVIKIDVPKLGFEATETEFEGDINIKGNLYENDNRVATRDYVDGEVNDGTLTLQTYGIASGSATFSANQSDDTTFSVFVEGTDLSSTHGVTTVSVTSSTGNDTSIEGATPSSAGVVTSYSQTWAGAKTFEGDIHYEQEIYNSSGDPMIEVDGDTLYINTNS